MNFCRSGVRFGASIAIASVIAVMTAGASAAATPHPSAVAAATSTCTGSRGGAEFEIDFQNQNPSFTSCFYSDQRSWMEAAKDGIARGDHDGVYQSMSIEDFRTNGIVDVYVRFSGKGANASVATSSQGTNYHAPGTFDGASGWKSATEVRCGVNPVTADGTEVLAIRDFAYHITQIVKSHAPNYTGSTVVSSVKLTAESDTSVTYNGAGCSA